MRKAILLTWLTVFACHALEASQAALNGGIADVRIVPSGPSLVRIDGRQLMVRKRLPDGTLDPEAPFVIRGVNWSPASPGTTNDATARRAEFGLWAATDAPHMAAMGVNAVRLYLDPGLDATGIAVLDELYAHDVMAIFTVDNGVNDLARLQQVVPFYKDHPAVLMWMLGSEWNINKYFDNPGCATVEKAAECTETAAQLVKALDSSHPVATSYGDIDINAPGMRLADTARYVNTVTPSVDIWSLNVFRSATFGNLFDQWSSITDKPMFIGEFGTDARQNATALIDETMQAHWDLCLWNDILGELSAQSPLLSAAGGMLFELNDEWWKVAPAGAQNPGGFSLFGGHPDNFANEEYFGLFDIDRQARRGSSIFAMAFDEAYVIPPRGLNVGAVSRGAAASQFPSQLGVARFYRCGVAFFDRRGGGGGGRGLNVVAPDPVTGEALQPPRNFDTWGTRSLCAQNDPSAAMKALVGFLDSLPSGALVMLSVADDAGLNLDNSCAPYSLSTCYQEGLAALEALGSTQIRDYCFRDSWAMIAEKGTGRAIAEGLGDGREVSLLSALPDPGAFNLAVGKDGTGTGSVVSDPAGIDCDSSCASSSGPFTTGTLVTLTATPSPGAHFVGWSGNEDCSNGVVTIDATKSCVASFCPDFDADGVCNAADLCEGNDATGDSDSDGICGELDLCPGSDDSQDTDSDGVPDGCDICLGDDATGDSDADSVCADRDCDDSDPNKVTPDACGVCGGDDSTCRIFSDGFESGDTAAWSSTIF